MSNKDISILVVERSIDPYGDLRGEHDISLLAPYLRNEGFQVELTWSLTKYRFEDFEGFLISAVRSLECKVLSDSQRDESIRESFVQSSRERLKRFVGLSKLFRRKPIYSVEDLACYDFLILHPDSDDLTGRVLDFIRLYPDKPVILPDRVLGVLTQEFPVENVRRDCKCPSVYAVNTNFNVELAVEKLIEHLWEKKRAS